MKNHDLMTTDELYAELKDEYGIPEVDMISPPRFNMSTDLGRTNPERLLGLTPYECIDLCRFHGACDTALGILRARADAAGGGWGEILRSKHSFDWFFWFVGCSEGIPPELTNRATWCNILVTQANEVDAAYMQVSRGERCHNLQDVDMAHTRATHAAQEALIAHWSKDQTFTLARSAQELSRLSNKLYEAKALASDQAVVQAALVEGEAPEAAAYLTAMHRGPQRNNQDRDDVYRRFDEAERGLVFQSEERMRRLRELLAQDLITSSVVIAPLTSPLQTPKTGLSD
jgi:hypothetical protein